MVQTGQDKQFGPNHLIPNWIFAFTRPTVGCQKPRTPFVPLNLPLIFLKFPLIHVYLNSVQQMVSGELAGEGLQTGFSRHGLTPQRAPLDTVYPLKEHLNSVQRRVSGGYCEGLVPDTVCWTRLRNTWLNVTRVILRQTFWEQIGNGRNTVSGVLFRKRELTEFCGNLGEFHEKLGEFTLTHK